MNFLIVVTVAYFASIVVVLGVAVYTLWRMR
jgi:hypothetical protein